MNETSPFEDQVRENLARQHDAALAASMLNRRERRRMGIRATKKEIERYLLATGLVISQADKL